MATKRLSIGSTLRQPKTSSNQRKISIGVRRSLRPTTPKKSRY